ncbi:SRPBCC family protein [Scopulibacillus cellulosilyticus]|uniref:Carbon monoxide dehydrogenase subunit G n=1 Tax=Scopulibacillus cellulosilyticus TaxID=2665665 RepID=A0ABW2PTU7_9BACL
MNVKGEVYVEATQEEVWKALNDPEVLKKATPGCKSLEETDTDHYKANITLGIAAVRGKYEADIKILDKSKPDKYRLMISANSSMGFVEGDALVNLEYQAPKTIIKYDGEAKVGGLIAGTGQRILSGIAKMIVKDFFKKIAKNVKHEQVG